MSWYDLWQQKVQTYRPPQSQTVYRPQQSSYRPQQSSGFNAWAQTHSSNPHSGYSTLPPAAGSTKAPTTDPVIPERFDFSLKYPTLAVNGGSATVPAPKVDTTGDWIGSIGGAVGAVASTINPMNAIPWLMERQYEISKAYAAQASDSDPLKGLAQVSAAGTGGFLEANKAVADIVAPIIDWLPNTSRDNHLRNRAKLYEQIVTGKDQDFGPLWLNLMEFTVPGTYNSGDEFRKYLQLRSELVGTLTPQQRGNNELQMKMLADAVDLPDEVKQAILKKGGLGNDGEIDKLIDDAVTASGKGRQWSYDPGPMGTISNIVHPLAWYLTEQLIATKGLGGIRAGLMGTTETLSGVETTLASGAKGVRFFEAGKPTEVGGWLGKIAPKTVAGGVTRPVPGLVANLETAGHSGAAGQITRIVGNASRAGHNLQKLQRLSMEVGLGTTAITTTMDAIARHDGNEAAVAWFDKLNSGGEFSHDAAVQLYTGFSVNPFEAAGELRNGMLTLGHGVDKVFLGKALGAKFLKTQDAGGVVDTLFQKMYKLDKIEDVQPFADQHYDNRGQMFDEVVGLAADHVLNALPAQERQAMILAHTGDPIGLTREVLTKKGDDIYDMLVNHQDELAQRFNRTAWEYHQYPGNFNADVAAMNARDFRLAKGRTYAFRKMTDSIVGYAEYLQPEAASRARAWLASATVNGKVAIEGRMGVQDLIRQFPAMRRFWQGKFGAGEKYMDAAQVEAMIAQGEVEFKAELAKNPLRAMTGSSPVLRHGAPHEINDVAQALGVQPNVSERLLGMLKNGSTEADADVARAFLKEKSGLDPAQVDAMDAVDSTSSAVDLFSKMTAPWYKAGDEVLAAERQIGPMRERLRVLYSIEPDMRTAQTRSRIAWIESELGRAREQRLPLRKAALAEQKAAAKLAAGEPVPTAARDALKAHDARYAPIKDELTALNRASPSGRLTTDDIAEIAELERRMESLNKIVSAAGDAPVPFAVDATLTARMAKVGDRIREINPEKMTRGDVQYVRDMLSTQVDVAYNRTISDLDALDLAKQWVDDFPQQSAHHESMLSRALDKVTAGRILGDISDLDTEALAVSHNVGGIGELMGLFHRVEGNWQWAGGASKATRGLRSDIFRVLTRPPTAGAFGEGIDTVARGQARFIHTMSDYEVWDFLDRNPSLQRSLNKRYRTAIENTRIARGGRITGSGPDTYIPDGYVGAPGMSNTDSWMDDAVNLVERYQNLLDEGEVRIGRGDTPLARDLSTLESRANRNLPQTYVDEAQQALEQDIYFDPARANGDRLAVREMRRTLDSEHLDTAMLDGEIRRLPIRMYNRLMKPFRDESGTLTRAWDEMTLQQRAEHVKKTLFPEGTAEPITSGPETSLDDMLSAGDKPGIERRSAEYMNSADQTSAPIRTTADRARALPGIRRSNEWRKQFRDFNLDSLAAPDPAVLAAPGNHDGIEVLSILNTGTIGTTPATIRRVVDLMALIEDGTATKMGIGVPFQEQAMKVAEDLLQSQLRNGKRLDFPPGVFEGGLDSAALGLSEYEAALQMASIEDVTRTRTPARRFGMVGDQLEVMYDPSDPLGTLQYGYKRRPASIKSAKGPAVVMEFQEIPGLAEEFLTGRYQTWSERVWTAKTRQAYNYVFGAHSNAAVRGAIRERFIARSVNRGFDPKVAAKIWDRWQKVADDSRGWTFRKGLHGTQELHGDSPMYAGIRNIPNSDLRHHALAVIAEEGTKIDAALVGRLTDLPIDDVFREAESFMRRSLVDSGWTLGAQLASMYGKVAHNKWTTFGYYMFRFGLDLRFHAMNFFESQILYAGRAGFRKGEIDTGLMGQSERALQRGEADLANNTGYALGHSRFSYAYRTFLKEQPDALRGAIKGLQGEDPALMEKAMKELATVDPQLVDMLKEFGETPEGWMRAIDEWSGKMLQTVDDFEAGKTIDDTLQEAMGNSPALAEVYNALGTANKNTWADVRKTFMGNPDRSRAERMLNSYLLFWPLSYQIKATKWMLRVMYDKMGGLPTNAGGAVMLGKLTESHRTLMETDHEYRAWYEKHPTLMFIAQALLPITPNSVWISMSPILRNMIPGGQSKALLDIGPVWTINHVVRPMAGEVGADVYSTLKSVPFGDAAFSSITGQSLDRYKPKTKPADPYEPPTGFWGSSG